MVKKAYINSALPTTHLSGSCCPNVLGLPLNVVKY